MKFRWERSKEEQRKTCCHWMCCCCLGLVETEDIKKLGMVQKGAAMVLNTCNESRAGSHQRQSRQLPPKLPPGLLCLCQTGCCHCHWGRRQGRWQSHESATRCVAPALLPQLQPFALVFPFSGQKCPLPPTRWDSSALPTVPGSLEPALAKHLSNFSLFIVQEDVPRQRFLSASVERPQSSHLASEKPKKTSDSKVTAEKRCI